jgi:YteA family regulatory protein
VNPERLEHFRRLLLKQREQLSWTRESMRVDQLGESLRDSVGELAIYDNHPADLGTETWERSKDLALRARAGVRLASVDDALVRIRDGTYGYCLNCGQPLPAARLEAIPEARYCARCSQSLEGAGVVDRPGTVGQRGGGPRPAEEEPLSPPFARTWRGDQGGTAWDGEDTWQAVARFGTSDTPSDVPGAHHYGEVFDNAGSPRGIVQPMDAMADDTAGPPTSVGRPQRRGLAGVGRESEAGHGNQAALSDERDELLRDAEEDDTLGLDGSDVDDLR